jgi:hypothetical protein
MESSLDYFLCTAFFLFLLPPITLVARPDVKRIACGHGAQPHKISATCASQLGCELGFEEGRDKTRHGGGEIVDAAHEVDGG